MKPSLPRLLDAAVDRIEAAKSLDRPSQAISDALARPMQIAGRPSQYVRDALHGTWLGHPLHPLLVTIPIGGWVLAFGFDVLAMSRGGHRGGAAAQAATTALKVGSAGAVAAAAAGMMDWQYTNGRDKRLGLVHAGVNTTSLALNLLSVRLRNKGRTIQGRLASATALAFMGAGGYLGGHMTYRRRVGVDHADRSPEPRDFVPVIALSDLQEDKPHRVNIHDADVKQDVGVVLVRHGGQVHAMGARCSHAGGPLDQGWLLNGTLVCPWHGSRYELATGRPVHGPSTCPQPLYEVRVRDGTVELRRQQEPGDEIVTSEQLARVASQSHPDHAVAGRKADEVLVEHHNMIRKLFRRIGEMPAANPERRDLMRILASELDLHEYVEDKIFYPAVQPVSEDVEIAHSEHQELSDLLAETLKLNTSTPEFEEHFRALNAALEHHATSEETSMFPEAQRLGEARLRELGAALESLFEEERASRVSRTFRALKVSLLESL